MDLNFGVEWFMGPPNPEEIKDIRKTAVRNINRMAMKCRFKEKSINIKANRLEKKIQKMINKSKKQSIPLIEYEVKSKFRDIILLRRQMRRVQKMRVRLESQATMIESCADRVNMARQYIEVGDLVADFDLDMPDMSELVFNTQEHQRMMAIFKQRLEYVEDAVDEAAEQEHDDESDALAAGEFESLEDTIEDWWQKARDSGIVQTGMAVEAFGRPDVMLAGGGAGSGGRGGGIGGGGDVLDMIPMPPE